MNPRRPAAFQSGSRPPLGLGRLTTTAAVGEGRLFLLGASGETVPPNGAPGGLGRGQAGAWRGVAWVSRPVWGLICTSWLRGSVCGASLGRLRKLGLPPVLQILSHPILKLCPVEAGGPSLQVALLDDDGGGDGGDEDTVITASIEHGRVPDTMLSMSSALSY